MCVDESGFNIFTRRSKGRASLGERLRRVAAPRGRNVNITLAVSPDMGLVHHIIEQRTVMRANFQAFINELVVILAPRVPINEEVFIIFDGVWPHLNIVVPPEFDYMWSCCRHIAHFSAPSRKPIDAWSAIKHFVLPHIQAEILHIQNMQAEAGLNQQQQWRAVLLRIGNNALQQITQQKCANWCARIHRISLHLSIEKSFAIKSDFINVNKYIVIVNEHFI